MGVSGFFGKKKETADSEAKGGEPDDKAATQLCFVLRKDATVGDLSRASKTVKQVLGEEIDCDVDEEGVITVHQGEDAVGFFLLIDKPIPNGEAESAADGNFLWPNGKKAAAEHRSHVIVATMGGDRTPVENAIVVTRLALIALKVYDGIGVYWGNASVSNSREAFELWCEGVSDKHLAVAMWLRYQFVRPAQGAIGIYTLGMDQFGLMDIEVDRCKMDPQELFGFVANIAHYLILQGPVIKDGETVGGSENERILVRHRPSMVDKTRRVYKIIFGI